MMLTLGIKHGDLELIASVKYNVFRITITTTQQSQFVRETKINEKIVK